MLINWFTVLAQIVNFLILIYLLRRFLFKPILGAMAEREKKIADALSRAEEAEQKAKEAAQSLEEARAAYDREREKRMAEAREQVAKWQEETLNAAREEVDALRRAWMANMTRERQAFLEGLKQRMVEQLVDVGERVFRDLADQGLNRQVVKVFLEKLAPEKGEISRHGAKDAVLVQSGIPLGDEDAEILREKLSRWLPEQTPIQLESVPGLGFGIELVAGDLKTAWHLADYLRDLEKEIMENLFKDARAELS